jgi:hypothetical protein
MKDRRPPLSLRKTENRKNHIALAHLPVSGKYDPEKQKNSSKKKPTH